MESRGGVESTAFRGVVRSDWPDGEAWLKRSIRSDSFGEDGRLFAWLDGGVDSPIA